VTFSWTFSRGLQNRLVVCKIVLSCGIKPRCGFRVIVCALRTFRVSDVLSCVLLAAALGWPRSFSPVLFLAVRKIVLAVVLFFSRGRFSSYGVVLLVLSLIKLCYFCSAITYGIASELILSRDLRDFFCVLQHRYVCSSFLECGSFLTSPYCLDRLHGSNGLHPVSRCKCEPISV